MAISVSLISVSSSAVSSSAAPSPVSFLNLQRRLHLPCRLLLHQLCRCLFGLSVPVSVTTAAFSLLCLQKSLLAPSFPDMSKADSLYFTFTLCNLVIRKCFYSAAYCIQGYFRPSINCLVNLHREKSNSVGSVHANLTFKVSVNVAVISCRSSRTGGVGCRGRLCNTICYNSNVTYTRTGACQSRETDLVSLGSFARS